MVKSATDTIQNGTSVQFLEVGGLGFQIETWQRGNLTEVHYSQTNIAGGTHYPASNSYILPQEFPLVAMDAQARYDNMDVSPVVSTDVLFGPVIWGNSQDDDGYFRAQSVDTVDVPVGNGATLEQAMNNLAESGARELRTLERSVSNDGPIDATTELVETGFEHTVAYQKGRETGQDEGYRECANVRDAIGLALIVTALVLYAGIKMIQSRFR